MVERVGFVEVVAISSVVADVPAHGKDAKVFGARIIRNLGEPPPLCLPAGAEGVAAPGAIPPYWCP